MTPSPLQQSTREILDAHLMVLRSRVQAGLYCSDDGVRQSA
jgi:hypothetical protein